MNDIHVTIIAILGCLLTLAAVFDIYLFIDNTKLCKSDALHKLDAEEYKKLYSEEVEKNKPREVINKVETFITEPIILKSKTSFSNYISMSDELKTRTIYEDLARGLVDYFIEMPNLVRVVDEVNPIYDSTCYQAMIRIIPFKED